MVDLTKTYDVLVMGGGNAALCAAISARRAGAIKFSLDPAALNDTVGPIGLLVAKARRAKDFIEERQLGMDAGFTVMLLLTAVAGLLLLVLRQTSAMNPLLALHLGVVFALFITLPYGKFVHGIYRFAALVRYEQEQRTQGY